MKYVEFIEVYGDLTNPPCIKCCFGCRKSPLDLFTCFSPLDCIYRSGEEMKYGYYIKSYKGILLDGEMMKKMREKKMERLMYELMHKAGI